MVLDSLGDSVQSALDQLRDTRGELTEEDIEPVVKEIQRALLSSDVDVTLVKEVTENIQEKALGESPPTGVSAREHVLNAVYEEMTDVVGDSSDIPLEGQTILLAGLQGAGKTTSSAKLSYWFEKKGLRTAMIQTDTFRPGAHEQSQQLAEEADVLYSVDPDCEDPVEQAQRGIEETDEADIQIVDTAGRHASEDALIEEIEDISETVEPDLNLLVIDAAMGSSAEEQARQFNDSIGIDGVVITKMDGTAKGGGALTAIREADTEIAFLGTGESVKDVERFDPNGFISRLLGMGDLQQLSERVERAMHETEGDDWEPEDVFEGEFTLRDMRKQMEAMNNMGALDEIMGMLPGMGSDIMNQIDDDMLSMQEEKMQQFKIVMDSMSEAELEDPDIITDERVERIARGSGTSENDIEELLNQYNQMKSLFDQMGSPEDMQKMARQFNLGGGGGLGGLF